MYIVKRSKHAICSSRGLKEMNNRKRDSDRWEEREREIERERERERERECVCVCEDMCVI